MMRRIVGIAMLAFVAAPTAHAGDLAAPAAPIAGSHLTFDHALHEDIACEDCHGEAPASGIPVKRPDPAVCMDCHGDGKPHLEQAASECATCHHPLAQATRLTAAEVAALSAPSSHADPSFLEGGHGRAACPADGSGTPASCGVCHTQQSCEVCHVATPEVASGLLRATATHLSGPPFSRRRPASHEDGWARAHGHEASADPRACAGCHAQEDCLHCHLPDAAAAPGNAVHPPDFLARHPAAAWSRETSCADCHDPRGFCASCHEEAGLTAQRPSLGSGFHDGANFLLGHGSAARRGLDTCVTCHDENDCLKCHSDRTGRGFSPHGPDFDAERLARTAAQMCTVCHGGVIPKR